jgi:hypothetical protein
MAWLPGTSTTVEPARSDMACWAGGGIVTFEITFDACLSAGAVTTEKKW